MRDIKRIDLNLLTALHVLTEERSVTRAADRLGLTQPTVSAMLVRLRKLFDDPLFTRTQRGIEPTPRALSIAAELDQWLMQAASLVASQSFDPAKASFTVALSANDYIQSSLIVPFLQRLRRQAPNARAVVRPATTTELTAMLARGELDIGVTSAPEIPSLDLQYRVLYEERYICAVRKEHPLRSKRVTVEQFCRFPHVLVSPTDGGFSGPTDLALSRVGLQRRVVLSLSSFFLLPEILRGDDLIAVVPARFLVGRTSGLHTFVPPLDIPGFSVVALWHSRQQKDATHKWLRELLAATALKIAPVQKTASRAAIDSLDNRPKIR